MTTNDLEHVLATLGATAWSTRDGSRARVAGGLALTVYAGHTRDQGTPYLQHPLAVVAVLRNELGVTDADTLLLGLLHDALEVAPASEALITNQLGSGFAARLRAMTPDHRLERRPKAPGDEAIWRAKTAGLPPEELLVRFADRIHNVRDLNASPSLERRAKFLRHLAEFHLPLAKSARPFSTHLAAAHTLLQAEYVRHQQEVRP
ncbi:HD domain-containing protein [Streptomyces sp. N2-109]|uniref:HD domain-containing protein n=1 Tax=Streptomyces gossypii TaxID=2883101 RepID=A0ABT2JPN4_9ACTN|nr:HD domain-containing protein [Streptomyces gossypii]MCT2589830.1 HD domain-containing protein [Streptomyces gossypii]